jgi:hypothetical protein
MLNSHAYSILQDLEQACNLFFAAMFSCGVYPKARTPEVSPEVQ